MNDKKQGVLAEEAVVVRPERRLKIAAAAEGWEAYNAWLLRVRQSGGPTSRQAVISKALYSVSSYKTWAEKAKGAFDGKK
jgi:hypothetical protein